MLKGISHDDIVNATKQFLFHHGPAVGFSGWGDIIQGLRDSGVDSVWHCVQHSGKSFKIRRDWSENPSWTWHVQDKYIGRCVCVMISIRRQKSYFQFNDSDDYTYVTYDVLPCKIK